MSGTGCQTGDALSLEEPFELSRIESLRVCRTHESSVFSTV